MPGARNMTQRTENHDVDLALFGEPGEAPAPSRISMRELDPGAS
jgi:hypothetical protein